MVRTGARAAVLNQVLLAAGLEATPAPPRPRFERLPPSIADELLTLYRRLGGRLDAGAFRPGIWDLSFGGGLVVELDEELHFNRYRALALSTSWSTDLPWTFSYRVFCERY